MPFYYLSFFMVFCLLSINKAKCANVCKLSRRYLFKVHLHSPFYYMLNSFFFSVRILFWKGNTSESYLWKKEACFIWSFLGLTDPISDKFCLFNHWQQWNMYHVQIPMARGVTVDDSSFYNKVHPNNPSLLNSS